MSKINENKPFMRLALVTAVIFLLAPIIIRMFGSEFITDRMLKDEVWKLHFIPAVIFAYYFGIKGAIFVAVFSAVSAFTVETKLIMMYGKKYVNFIRHLSIEVAATLLFAITIGVMAEKLKEQQRKLAEAYERLTNMAVLEERNHLARELHDGLAQSLGCMNLKVMTIDANISENNLKKGRKHLVELREVLDEAYEEVRHHIFGLNYKFNTDEPFLLKLTKYLTKYEKISGIDVHYSSDINLDFVIPAKIQDNLFRIIQEGTANVRKHAEVTRLSVEIRLVDNNLAITITDAGIGFNVDEAQVKPDRFGLTIMKQRAEVIGAFLDVQSKPDEGTRVKIVVPKKVLEGEN